MDYLVHKHKKSRVKLMSCSKIKNDYLHYKRIDKSSYREFQSSDESREWGNKFYIEWSSAYFSL